MKHHRSISTAVFFLVLGITLPLFAQKGEEEKGGAKAAPAQEHQAQPQRAQPAQHAAPAQHAQAAQQKAAPQRAPQAQEKAAPQRAQTAQRPAQPQRAQAVAPARQATGGNNGSRGGGQYGRISNASYGSHFGHDHSFHMGHPQMIGGYNRFQYGGYWFGYNQEWPVGWGYDDNVYVVYEGGGYYMYDLTHPGIHISLSIF
jgi:hypothetical protein